MGFTGEDADVIVHKHVRQGRVAGPAGFSVGIIVGVITVFVLGLIAYYILFPARGFFHSDTADTIMWAEAAYEAGAVFNPDFDYAGLLPFGGHLIMAPLVALFGVSMRAHVLGMLIFFLLFASALFWLLRQIGWSARWCCFAVSYLVLVLSMSKKLREIYWEHIIYYSLGIFLLFVGLALVLRAMRLARERPSGPAFSVSLVLIVIWFLLAATNQLEALTLFIVPVLVGLTGERFLDFDNSLERAEKRRNGLILLAALAGSAAGYMLGGYLKAGSRAAYQSGYSCFAAPADWMGNALKFCHHWLTLLGVTAGPNDPLFDQKGIINLIRILFAMTLLLAPVIMTIRYRQIEDRPSRILVLTHWTLSGLVLLGYVFGSLSSANWRLSPIICTSAILTVMLARRLYQRLDRRRLAVLAVMPFLLAGSFTVADLLAMRPNLGQDTGLYALAAYLEEQDLSYGYATYWQANALTVISDSAVQVRPGEISDGLFKIKTYQANNTWYQDKPGQTTYFLLLKNKEFQDLRMAGRFTISDAARLLEFDDYIILVYEANLFGAETAVNG
jgi:hypothetical protein